MNIDFYHIGGASFVLNVDGVFKIACDPSLSPEGTEYKFKSFVSKRTIAPIYDSSLLEDVRLWLVTHDHEDHIDSKGASHISQDSIVVSHKKAIGYFSDHPNFIPVAWGNVQAFSIEGYHVCVTTVPAFHGNNLLMRKMVGAVNGYILQITKHETTKSVYITSDTVYHPKIIHNVRKFTPLDLMIANLGEVLPNKFGGPLTMSTHMLSQMVKQLNPKRIIPIHINDFSHYTTKPEELLQYQFEIIDRGSWVSVI